jgi:hypothetical protein
MTRPAGLLVALLLLLPACERLTPAEDRTIRRWLLCEECVEGELDSVVALGDRAIGRLGAALRGPPEEGKENVLRQTRAMLDRTTAIAADRQTYIRHYLENYVAIYQVRAAIALDRINTPSADALLLWAARGNRPYRDDVVAAIGQALGATLVAVAGDSQHAPVDSLVRVDPTVLVRIGPTQQPASAIRVVFQVDSGGGTVLDPVTYTDADGRAHARWRLGTVDSSLNILTALAAGRTVRFSAVAHAPGVRVVFVVQPGNGKAGQPLSPAARVEVHDAWGAVQGRLQQSVLISVEGTAIGASYTLTGGAATLTGFSVPAPGTFHLLAKTLGAVTARSAAFTVVP